MQTARKQELEVLWRSTGRANLPRELAPIHPSRASSAHLGSLKIFGLLAALALFLAAGPPLAMAASGETGAPKVPNFSLLANDGQTYTPDYLKGNVVLLFFWATWCPYCRKAVPHMNDLASMYANSPFTIIGICGGKDAQAWQNYIREHQMRWPQYYDRNIRMGHLFQARGIPNFFLINKNGFIVYHQRGWDDSTAGRFEKLIDRTLAEPGQ